MRLFLFMLIPLACLLYFTRDIGTRRFLPVFLTVSIVSVVFCALKAFFSFEYRIPPMGFLHNYIYFLMGESLVPLIIIYGLFFLLSKDTLEYKILAFFPATAPFYAIFIPYKVSTGELPYPFFVLFLKPLLYLSMLFYIASVLVLLYRRKISVQKNDVLIAVYSLNIVAAVFVPGIIECLWFIGKSIVFWLPIFLLYECAAVYFLFAMTEIKILPIKKIAGRCQQPKD